MPRHRLVPFVVVAALAAATGVFFSGGDQAQIMDVLADAALLRSGQSVDLRRER